MTDIPDRARRAWTSRITIQRKGLCTILAAEAGEKHFARAKDSTKLCAAIDAKIDAEADYVVWRDGVVTPRNKRNATGANQHRKRGQAAVLRPNLPEGDPGQDVADRWRKNFTSKVKGETVRDQDKIAEAKAEAAHRAVRICEQEKDGTVRGTEATGEFERYTPAIYIEAARLVLGAIDLDPATSEQAQLLVRATKFFTEKTDGLKQEWHGRVLPANPPYHREPRAVIHRQVDRRNHRAPRQRGLLC